MSQENNGIDDLYMRIFDAGKERDRAESEVMNAVQACREAGWTWQRIGNTLGVSRQAAQQRYGWYCG